MHRDARPTRRGSPRLASGLLGVALLAGGLAASLGAPASGATDTGVPPPAAYILVDAGTGAVITARHPHEALPPASTAKIMTALVGVERIPPNATIRISDNAANREAMKIGMQAGTAWPFSQAMAPLMMVSANDAAYAVAEAAGGGSISGFAAAANATARRYGMRDSTWGDPAGLTDTTSYNGGPKVSAYDLAIATRNALRVPAIAKWADTRTFDFTDSSGLHHQLVNHDKFLPGNAYGYEGANGFKTGYTEIAGHTLVATAKRHGRQCIAVILGSSDSGYQWAGSLLDQCWVRPKVATTGTFLPPIAVSPYAARATEGAAFTHLALGNTGAKLAAAGAGTARANTGTQTATVSPLIASPLAATTPAGTSTSTSTSKHHGLLTPTRIAFLLFLALVAAFVLRRRAVKRQHARRIARRRARAKAMRSGSLPVVDGRYRTGTRVGQPVESRVRVARTHIDLTEEDRPPVRRSRASGPRAGE